MMIKKLLATIALLAISSILANATLVGSLHINTNQDATNVFSLSGFTTRIAPNGTNYTQGIVEGDFSLLAGNTNGTEGYDGMDVGAFTIATKLSDFNRFGSSTAGGIAVWDFDLSGIASNAWELKVHYDQRRTDCQDSGWYISLNGLGRALDTTDVTTLTPGTGSAVLSDITKYIKIGELPAATQSGTNAWNLTEIIQAAQANDGLVRLVYNDHSFMDDIRFINDSGLIGTNSTSATPVEYPTVTVMLQDDFSTGSGTSFGTVPNGWVSQGPEEKTYNTNDFDGTDFTGKLGWIATNDILNGTSYFDTIAIGFDSYTLSETNDFISVSFDYQTISTKDATVGLRVRLYEQGGDLFSTSPGAYGLNIPSGASTVNLGYKYVMNTAPYNGGDPTGNAVNSGVSYGNGGSVTFTVTKTGTNEITLSGSHGTNIFMTQVAATNLFTFDAFGLTVGSLEHGLEIDNVAIKSSMPAPFILFADDFQTGTASSTNGPLVNGWSALGFEDKEYNVASSGILDIRDQVAPEGTNAVHEGSWDTVQVSFQGVPLANDGDWLKLSFDLGMYQDTSFAAIPTGATPRVSLVDSTKTNEAGYNFLITTGVAAKWHKLGLVDSALDWPTVLSPGVNQVLAVDGSLQTWTLLIQRSGGDFLLSPTLAGTPWGSDGTTFTNNWAVDAIFDQLTFSVGNRDMAMKIDNVRVTSNVMIPADTAPLITQTVVDGGSVTIDFTAGAGDTAGDFVLQSASTVNGAFADDGLAGPVTGGGGSFQVTTSVNGPTQFYRIRRN